MKLNIEIENITGEGAETLVNIVETMHVLGSIGSSRELRLYADGDGRCRPRLAKTNVKPTLPRRKIIQAAGRGTAIGISSEHIYTCRNGEWQEVTDEQKDED